MLEILSLAEAILVAKVVDALEVGASVIVADGVASIVGVGTLLLGAKEAGSAVVVVDSFVVGSSSSIGSTGINDVFGVAGSAIISRGAGKGLSTFFIEAVTTTNGDKVELEGVKVDSKGVDGDTLDTLIAVVIVFLFSSSFRFSSLSLSLFSL